jgi:hypothetical protein
MNAIAKNSRLHTITDYLLVAGLVAISGFPFFMIAQINFTYLFLLAGFVYIKRSISFDTRALLIVFFFLAVEILQVLFIKPLDPIMILGTLVRLFVGFFIICLTGKSFTRYYVNIIYFFAWVSFVFFIPSMVIPGFFSFFVNHVCPFFASPYTDAGGYYMVWPTNFIFCFHDCILSDFRNPGPFWEPGLFAVFLNIALLFHLINEKKIISKKTVVITLAILSTFSTAGYLACFMVIFCFYLVHQTLAKKILFSMVAIPAMLSLYFSLDFLSAKVEQNIDLAGSTTTSRFGSASVDLADFSTSPFIGWGRGVMRYGGRSFTFFSEDQHRYNSVTDLLATYGIFLFLFFFSNYYQSLKMLCSGSGFKASFAPYALLVILMLGFSQSIFMKPFFYSLMFIQFVYPKSQPQ